MSAIPLPTPRAVICQASQVTNSVPAVSVSSVAEPEPRSRLGHEIGHSLETAGDAVGLECGDQDRERER